MRTAVRNQVNSDLEAKFAAEGGVTRPANLESIAQGEAELRYKELKQKYNNADVNFEEFTDNLKANGVSGELNTTLQNRRASEIVNIGGQKENIAESEGRLRSIEQGKMRAGLGIGGAIAGGVILAAAGATLAYFGSTNAFGLAGDEYDSKLNAVWEKVQALKAKQICLALPAPAGDPSGK